MFLVAFIFSAAAVVFKESNSLSLLATILSCILHEREKRGTFDSTTRVLQKGSQLHLKRRLAEF